MSGEKKSFWLYCANKRGKVLLPDKFFAALYTRRRTLRCTTSAQDYFGDVLSRKSHDRSGRKPARSGIYSL